MHCSDTHTKGKNIDSCRLKNAWQSKWNNSEINHHCRILTKRSPVSLPIASIYCIFFASVHPFSNVILMPPSNTCLTIRIPAMHWKQHKINNIKLKSKYERRNISLTRTLATIPQKMRWKSFTIFRRRNQRRKCEQWPEAKDQFEERKGERERAYKQSNKRIVGITTHIREIF